MAADSGKKLLIQGYRLDVLPKTTAEEGECAGLLQASVRGNQAFVLGRDRAGTSEDIEVSGTEDDVVELTLEDGLVLYTSVGRITKEFVEPEQQRASSKGTLCLPKRLTLTSRRSRGIDDLVVESLKVLDVKGKIIDAATEFAGKHAARKIAEIIENQLVGDQLLYRFNDPVADPRHILAPADLDNIDTTKPILLFLHGTASSTTGSFSGLWSESAADWKKLTGRYGTNILAFEHRTLTKSPIENVVELLQILPEDARLHLVSHSRGGLVGELLCRGQFSNGRPPISDDDLTLFAPHNQAQESQTDYQRYQEQLETLRDLFRDKRPKVEKFVRVACPARGTTLASGKLDLYLSGILNVIGLIPPLKQSQIYGIIKAFLLAVVKQRTKPEELPGLEAQMPGSPFIAMLNSCREHISAPLAVIKGDIEPAGIMKKISMFFLDRFYESDHDLVVNTPSMDGGAWRLGRIPILFAQGNEVNHFSYFKNKETRKGLLNGLLSSSSPPKGFQLEPQKAVHIARSLPLDKQRGEAPVVFILPGLIGSHLAVDNERVWLDFSELARGRFSDLACGQENITAMEPVASVYGGLADYLSQSHEVIPFAYDWRLSVLESGLRLGQEVEERLRNTSQPIRIIAHSMGGMVVRGMMVQCPDVWKQFCQRPGSRVLMLGTPNRGSHSISRILAGQERIVRLLALADLRNNKKEIIDIIRRFSGILELLPEDGDGKIHGDTTWKEFVKALKEEVGVTPTVKDLNAAQKVRTKLNEVPLNQDVVMYVAGQAEETPVALQVDQKWFGKEKIVFSSTSRGDGRVPWDTGIPEGIKRWFVRVPHGDIPAHSIAFDGFMEILETGNTRKLACKAPISREAEKQREMMADYADMYPDTEMIENAALGKDMYGRWHRHDQMPVLKVAVVHGNLCFTRYPLAVGHYDGDTIVSAEAALDERLGHRLSRRLQLGVYPGPLMTSETFFSHGEEQFPGALVVGLGEVGKLSPGELCSTFRDAVLRFATDCMESNTYRNKKICLSTLIIGTGSGGISMREAMTALLRGVILANGRLAGPVRNGDRVVSELEFIEVYEDRAIEAQHTILELAGSAEFKTRLAPEKRLLDREGGQRRAFTSEDVDWWQRLRIETKKDGSLEYTSLAPHSRAVIQGQPIQRQSIEPFLSELTSSVWLSDKAGRVLFELLVPRQFKVHAAENRKVVLVVDRGSAGYPWELMEYGGQDGNQPLSVRAGMVRQLALRTPVDADICTDPRALVVGDPDLKKSDAFLPLPGARQEAEKVAELLKGQGIELSGAMLRPNGCQILTKLMTNNYGILHLAGHGVVDYELAEEDVCDCCNQTVHKGGKITGMVIGDNHFLTAVEFRQMPVTPAFVFINCCHLGKTGNGEQKQLERPHHLAASLAVELISQGVRAVIAAGWAVDDEAAMTFASTFYTEFLGGLKFGDAVKAARVATRKEHPQVNTWGAYQCYGDPGYSFREQGGETKNNREEEFVSVIEYIRAVENIAGAAKTASQTKAQLLCERLAKLEKRIPRDYADNAELLEAQGKAWGELDQFQSAITSYEKALQAQRAGASITSAEQLSNFQVRYAVELEETGQGADSPDLVTEAVERLQALNGLFGKTIERLNLLGGCYKRKAVIVRQNRQEVFEALNAMKEHYQGGSDLYYQEHKKYYSYPLINVLAAKWLLALGDEGGAAKFSSEFDELLEQARSGTEKVSIIDREHFWSAIAENDINLLATLKANRLADEREGIVKKYKEIKVVGSSARQFRSVVEHIDFLKVMATELGYAHVADLERLAEQLRSEG